jgi:hypothetical protein
MAAQSAASTKKVLDPPSSRILAHFKYTTLFAGDDEQNRDRNHKFIVQRSIATSVSRTIKDMFDGVYGHSFIS